MRRQVHRDIEGQRLARLAVPIRERARGAVHRPAAERQDQPGFLGDRDEFGRPDLAAILMDPARQRLEPRDLAGPQADQRLVVEVELVLLDRPAKLGLDRKAPPRLGRLARLVDLRLARQLRLLDRELGVAEQFLAVLPRGHHGEADRAFDAELELAQPERRLHHLLDALGRAQRFGDSALQGKQDPELIATGPRQHVAGTKRHDQPPRKGHQQLVTGERTEALVDAAEAQQVDHQDGMLVVLRRDRAQTLDRLREGETVGQAGQAVANHLVAQRSFGLDLEGPVDDAEQAARRTVGSRRQRGELQGEHPADRAVAVDELALVGHAARVGQEGADESAALPFRIEMEFVGELRQVAAAAGYLVEFAVDRFDPQPGVAHREDPSRDRQRVDEIAVHLAFDERAQGESLRPLRGRGVDRARGCSLHGGHTWANWVNSRFLFLSELLEIFQVFSEKSRARSDWIAESQSAASGRRFRALLATGPNRSRFEFGRCRRRAPSSSPPRRRRSGRRTSRRRESAGA